MSFGVLLSAEWGMRSVEELLHEADTTLYEAKAAGRDRLRLAKPAKKTEPPTTPVPESVPLRH